MINLQDLLDDAKCYDKLRQLRWPAGVLCPHCEASLITKSGEAACDAVYVIAGR